MTNTPEIVLPTGTRTVLVSDIPNLLAKAIHPGPDAPVTLHQIIKKNTGPNGEPEDRTYSLTDDDMTLLVEILGPAPEPGEVTSDEKWMAYIGPWFTSPQRPAWIPGRQCADPSLDAALLRADAKESHKAALIAAIRNGSFVPLNHALVPLEGWTGELLSIGQVFVQQLSDYAAKFGITVRVELDRVIVQDLLDRISEGTADRRPEKWQHGEDQRIGRTIVAVMNAQGWPTDGIPGVLDFICKAIECGRVSAFSAFNDVPCTDVSLVRTNPAQWYITPEGESHIIHAIAGAVTRTQDRVRERTEQTEKQRAEKEAAGRYTLEEAAKLIATNAGERESAVLAELVSAVTEGKLTVHEPGRNLPYRPTTVHKFYEEAYWNDLNAWLDGIRFRNPWRFLNPQKSDVRPDSLAVKHELAILSAVGALNLKPTALQRGTPGKPGAKAAIKVSLTNLTDSQFENAWERLRAAKTIRYADEPLS